MQKTNSHQPQLKSKSLLINDERSNTKLTNVKEEVSSSSENSSFRESSSDQSSRTINEPVPVKGDKADKLMEMFLKMHNRLETLVSEVKTLKQTDSNRLGQLTQLIEDNGTISKSELEDVF
jgi:hypothetical protein